MSNAEDIKKDREVALPAGDAIASLFARISEYVDKDDYTFGSMIVKRRYVSRSGKERDIFVTVTVK